jgi:hypothetical protein
MKTQLQSHTRNAEALLHAELIDKPEQGQYYQGMLCHTILYHTITY